jgi:photosystem II stability/assembly factor-like uncharacterized protein
MSEKCLLCHLDMSVPQGKFAIQRKTRYERSGSVNSSSSTQKISQTRQWQRVLTRLAAILTTALVLGSLVLTFNGCSVVTTKPTPTVISAATTTSVVTKPTVTAPLKPTLAHSPTDVVGIHMVDSSIGWVTCRDGGLLRTTDGGRNWLDVTPTVLLTVQQQHSIAGSLFQNGSTAWIIVRVWLNNGSVNNVHPLVFHTSDAGQTWQEGAFPRDDSSVTSVPYYKITAISAQEAWVLDTSVEAASTLGALYGVTGLYHTINGGETWIQVRNLPPISQHTYPPAISFANQKTGMIIGNVPAYQTTSTFTVVLTQDGGASWHVVNVRQPDPAHWQIQGLFSPQFLTPNDGIFMGAFKNLATGNEGLTVFSTHDGGQTWTNAPMENVGGYGGNAGAKFFDPQRGYVLAVRTPTGPLQFYTTSDGGQHWNMIPLNLPKHYGAMGTPSIDSLDFGSLTIGWALWNASSLRYATSLITTADGGKTWTQVHAHFPAFITPKSAY